MTTSFPDDTASLPQLISLTLDRVMNGLTEHLAGRGFSDLRPTHCVNVLRHIDCDGTRPTVIAQRAGMTPQAISELVGHLERVGYVRRVPDPADGRARIVVYAERGASAAQAAERYFTAMERGWAEMVGDRRLDTVKATLARILSGDESTTDTEGTTT
ncbi:MarR family winged helix-turn-helix transcriptional regulator [Stackebrandtia soli]|uniref:MarR family winged helix-turn-helix transcriptional regulator n=1 Tax=Stackebrandtia soli TaxID=1892856 RepID=UPI0039E93DE6